MQPEFQCQPNPDCKYYYQGCFHNRHHPWFPANEYSGGVFKRLRKVSAIVMCAALHDTIHATTEPPERPTEHEAVDMLINRDETYQRFMQTLLEQVEGLNL